jgi:branched-chain amino acid aminotransferase
MVETLKINTTKVKESKLASIDFSKLPFGHVFTDHMFIADFKNGEWGNLRINPYSNISISPATPALHYGQSIFEGMKAYSAKSGDRALVFRPLDNWRRMNISAERLCMPSIPEELFMESLGALIDIDREWVPKLENSSLYIRPFLFSADEYIGIRPSEEFTFMIILSPTGPYYSAPVKVKIETQYTRAVQGGTGYAKAGGNYAGAIYPAKLAQNQGYHQLIWTDGRNHEYIEESGTMNVMFVIDGVLITPELSDSILAGITRASVLELARYWGMPVEERKISVKELVAALEKGKVQEAFGAGTAATIAHIELIGFEGKDYHLPPIKERAFGPKVLDELEKIKHGEVPDVFGWVHRM